MLAYVRMRPTLARCLGFTIILVTVVAVAVGASATETESGREVESEARNEVGIFLGAAIKNEDETESGFALGVDYEFRLYRALGVGLVVEVATGDLRDAVVLAQLAVHTWRGLSVVAAPGVEVSRDEGAEFAMRFGTSYDFEVGQFSIGPEFNVDLVDREPTFVFGLAFGVAF